LGSRKLSAEAKEPADEVDRFEETEGALGHDDLDRVEVPLASEAAPEIREGIGGRMKASARRAAKGRPCSARLRRYAEVLNDDED
jgi:hypothetical protein